jgi:hypothetical protein
VENGKYRPLLLQLSQVSRFRRTATGWASALLLVQVMVENKWSHQLNIAIVLILSLVIIDGCRGNTVPLAPTSTSPPRANPQSSLSSLPEPPDLYKFKPMECMEERSQEFIISTDDPTQAYFVDEPWVIIPLRICKNSYDDRSDYNWLFSLQVNSVISTAGIPLDKLPKMYLRYRQHPDDDNRYIRGDEGAVYVFSYNDRTNKHHALASGDRGIYDLIFEFEDTDALDNIPRTIDFSITIEIWVV